MRFSLFAFAPLLFVCSTALAQEEPVQPELQNAPVLNPLPPQQQPQPPPVSTTTTTNAEIEAPPAQRDVPSSTPPRSSDEDDTRRMKIHQVDAHLAMNADMLLGYIGIGAGADIGVVAVGPGMLAVGLGFEYDFCGSTCWTFSAATPINYSEAHLFPQARASYHLGMKRFSNLDLYPFIGTGPVFAKSKIGIDNGAARYIGSDTGVGLDLGMGANMFFGKSPFFAAAEGHLRYAGGTYAYRLDSGDGTRSFDRGAVSTWNMSGIDVLLALGVRLQ
jgi:hypothetical protein